MCGGPGLEHDPRTARPCRLCAGDGACGAGVNTAPAALPADGAAVSRTAVQCLPADRDKVRPGHRPLAVGRAFKGGDGADGSSAPSGSVRSQGVQTKEAAASRLPAPVYFGHPG